MAERSPASVSLNESLLAEFGLTLTELRGLGCLGGECENVAKCATEQAQVNMVNECANQHSTILDIPDGACGAIEAVKSVADRSTDNIDKLAAAHTWSGFMEN